MRLRVDENKIIEDTKNMLFDIIEDEPSKENLKQYKLVTQIAQRYNIINAKNENDCTALIKAVQKENRYGFVKILIKAKIDINIENKQGESVIRIVSQKLDKEFNSPYYKILKTILKYHALSNIKERDLLERLFSKKIHNSAYKNLIQLLLKSGINPNAEGFDGSPLLSHAAYCGDDTTLRTLLSLKAHPNAQSYRSNTPLMHAAKRDHLRCVKLLLESNANPNLININHIKNSSVRYIQRTLKDYNRPQWFKECYEKGVLPTPSTKSPTPLVKSSSFSTSSIADEKIHQASLNHLSTFERFRLKINPAKLLPFRKSEASATPAMTPEISQISYLSQQYFPEKDKEREIPKPVSP